MTGSGLVGGCGDEGAGDAWGSSQGRNRDGDRPRSAGRNQLHIAAIRARRYAFGLGK